MVSFSGASPAYVYKWVLRTRVAWGRNQPRMRLPPLSHRRTSDGTRVDLIALCVHLHAIGVEVHAQDVNFNAGGIAFNAHDVNIGATAVDSTAPA